MRRVLAAAALALAGASVASAAVVPGLRTPTRNIHCVVAERTDPRNRGGLWCQIDRASYRARLQATCGGIDWRGWVLSGNDAGQVNCSGGAEWFGTPRYVTLAYGRAWRRDGYTCRSARTGLTCTNRRGHGVFISRESWRAW
ncbi:MAG TPA: DUF6636 domain-containing protein [Gaiellaceae bacterium]